MKLVSISEARSRLMEFVQLAEGGEDIVLTRHGQAKARLVPLRAAPTALARRELMERVRVAGSAKASSGLDAARSQDFLYGDDELAL